MSDLEEQVREIKHRINQAQQTAARAAHEFDRAKASADQAAASLESEFGVTDKESAAQTLQQLQSDLEAAIGAIKTSLEEMGV